MHLDDINIGFSGAGGRGSGTEKGGIGEPVKSGNDDSDPNISEDEGAHKPLINKVISLCLLSLGQGG